MSCIAVLGLHASAAHSSGHRLGEGSHALRQLAIQHLGALPVRFEPNRGQATGTVRFIGRGAGYTLFLSSRDAVLVSSRGSAAVSAPAHLHLVGANPSARFVGRSRLPGTVNYLRGEHPRGWQLNLPTYGQVIERAVYPGMDLRYHSSATQLEYDWLLHPGADPHRIALSVGPGRAVLSSTGDLLLHSTAGVLVQHRPQAYQLQHGKHIPVAAAYRLLAGTRVALHLGTYDHHLPLVIDPTLTYSTYLGGPGEDQSTSIVVDASGSAYVGGYTGGGFPTKNAYGTAQNGGFLTKLSPDGSQLIYSTYLGDNATVKSVALGPDGDVTVSGQTDSPFPQMHPLLFGAGGAVLPPGSVPGPVAGLLAHLAGNQPTIVRGFVARLHFDSSSSTLSLVYSTYVGDSGQTSLDSVAVDSGNHAYVGGTTTATDFPTVHSLQPCGGQSVVSARLDYDPTLQQLSLTYSTCLGFVAQYSRGVLALDASANVYLTGATDYAQFSTTDGSVGHGKSDVFVLKLQVDSSGAPHEVYSTLLGGAGDDSGLGITVDAAGDAYVVGKTQSADFPILHPFQTTLDYVQDAFVLELDPTGKLAYSTYLGGKYYDEAFGVVVGNASGNNSACTGSCDIFVTGGTSSPDYSTKDPLPEQAPAIECSGYLIVTELRPATGLLFSTTLTNQVRPNCSATDGNAIARDSAGALYVAGSSGANSPTTPNAFQPAFAGGLDVVVLKIAVGQPTVARVSRFAVQRHAASLHFSWWLAVSHDVAGFNLHAGSHRLNAHTIPVHASPLYRYQVRHAPTGPYWLKVLLRNGQTVRVSPD